MAYKYSGSIDINATKNGLDLESLYEFLAYDIGTDLTNRIIEDIEAHIEEQLEHVTPSINIRTMRYDIESDTIIDLFSKKPQKPRVIEDYTDSKLPKGYVVKFNKLKFVKERPIIRRRSRSLTRNKRNSNRNTRKRHSL